MKPLVARVVYLSRLGGKSMRSQIEYWFPAKRYGWGWGLPITWQGWLVFAAFIGLVAVGLLVFPPHKMLLTLSTSLFSALR
jgi:hypothetical protein